MSDFNTADYIKTANEREHARSMPGQPLPKMETAKEVAKADEPEAEPKTEEEKEAQHARLPRSVRRELNRLREEAAEARGRLAAMQEFHASGGKKPEAEEKPAEVTDPAVKPVREKFDSDAAFTEALATWSAQQVHERVAKRDEMVNKIAQMTEKAEADQLLIPDFDAHMAEADKSGPKIDWEKNSNLLLLIANSEYQALVRDYYATHPDELEEIVSLTPKPVDQIAEFRALEGHLKRVYASIRKASTTATAGKQTPEPKKEEKTTPVVKLPKPSEAAATHGGSAPSMSVSPYLADGRTLNPAWKEQRNQRERGR